jgi:Phospholipase_D-nuclease N-terminal
MESDAVDTATDGKSRRKKKRWSDFSPRQQTAIVLGAIAELIMTTIALRDLASRPATHVRGSKLLWLLAFFVQPVGPILYLFVGRRDTTR